MNWNLIKILLAVLTGFAVVRIILNAAFRKK